MEEMNPPIVNKGKFLLFNKSLYKAPSTIKVIVSV
jgi:hypothetical protein